MDNPNYHHPEFISPLVTVVPGSITRNRMMIDDEQWMLERQSPKVNQV